MARNQTRPTDADVGLYLGSVEPDRRRDDAFRLDAIYREVTGFHPVMWGPSIVGYGRYHYRYPSGHEGDFLATGFAARKTNLVLYILPGYADYARILDDLGKHRLGKSCLYLTSLAQVNEDALRRLIRAGLDDLARHWPVEPS